MIHAFSRFGWRLNALCCLVIAHILVHISQYLSLPRVSPGALRGPSGGPCTRLARRAIRFVSPLVVPATDAGPPIYALISINCWWFDLQRAFFFGGGVPLFSPLFFAPCGFTAEYLLDLIYPVIHCGTTYCIPGSRCFCSWCFYAVRAAIKKRQFGVEAQRLTL